VILTTVIIALCEQLQLWLNYSFDKVRAKLQKNWNGSTRQILKVFTTAWKKKMKRCFL